MSRKEALSQFIQQIHGRPVVVKLNSGVDYRGKCVVILVLYLPFVICIILKTENISLFWTVFQIKNITINYFLQVC